MNNPEKYSSVNYSFKDAVKLHGQGQLHKAKEICEKIIERTSNHIDAINLLCLVSYQLKDINSAIKSVSQAIKISPNNAALYCNRGILLSEQKNYKQSIKDYNKAIELQPSAYEPYLNRANCLQNLRQFEAAIRDYDLAINIKPDLGEAYFNRGNAFKQIKLLREAVSSYRKALQLSPNLPFLFGTYFQTLMMCSDWANYSSNLLLYESQIEDGRKVAIPFEPLAFSDKPHLHLKAAQVFSQYNYPSTTPNLVEPFSKNQKIRIGYFSADFRNHATSSLIAELFELHNTDKFEIYGFSIGPSSSDEMRQRISLSFYKFFDLCDAADREILDLSRDLNIDIAIDLNGYTQYSRPGIFKQRAAPIQINYLGYPGTMGVDCYDYIISDEYIIPKSSCSLYTEKIIYLPHTYQVNDSKRIIGSKEYSKTELGLPETGFIYCCFNNNVKINPPIFDVWMRILLAVQGSVLWLYESNECALINLKNEAEKRGVNPERLIFAKPLQSEDNLSRLGLADLFIDTMPYNAHTTASDALWVGLPVLTCSGESFASRVAGSLLNAIELPELIMPSLWEYEKTAIELALNPFMIKALKKKLKMKINGTPLFNCKLFVKHLESAFMEAYMNHRIGKLPDHIHVKI